MSRVVKKRVISCDYRLLVDGKAQNKFKRDYPRVPIFTVFIKDGILTNVPKPPENGAYLIGIRNDPYHAVAAFKHGKHLFCFDSHGKQKSRINVFVKLAKKIGVDKNNIYFYRGKALQTSGYVCVGHSVNFLSKMADHFSKTNRIPNKNQYSRAVYNTMSKNNKNIFPSDSLNKSLMSRETPTKINIITPDNRKRKVRGQNTTPMNINNIVSFAVINGEPMMVNTTPGAKRIRRSDTNMTNVARQLFKDYNRLSIK